MNRHEHAKKPSSGWPAKALLKRSVLASGLKFGTQALVDLFADFTRQLFAFLVAPLRDLNPQLLPNFLKRISFAFKGYSEIAHDRSCWFPVAGNSYETLFSSLEQAWQKNLKTDLFKALKFNEKRYA